MRRNKVIKVCLGDLNTSRICLGSEGSKSVRKPKNRRGGVVFFRPTREEEKRRER